MYQTEDGLPHAGKVSAKMAEIKAKKYKRLHVGEFSGTEEDYIKALEHMEHMMLRD